MNIQVFYRNFSSWMQQHFVSLQKNLSHFFAQRAFLNIEPSKKNLRIEVQPALEGEGKEKAAKLIQRTVKKYLAAKKKASAVTVIQRAVKKYIVSQRKKKTDSAIIIQRAFRAHLQSKKKQKAVSIIQTSFREYRQLASRHILPSALSLLAREWIDQGIAAQFPRSESGKTPVYFPPHLPVVLKETTIPANRERLKKTLQAKAFCETAGYHHLTIPSASIYRNWVIEKRLPISMGLDQKEQIGLYIENREAFTPAVIEFTAFLCQAELEDLSGMVKNNPWSSLCEAGLPRYDNAALYLSETGEGKIGLVDLETFKLLPEGASQKQVARACVQAMRLFPLHVPEIIEEARKFDPQLMAENRELLEEQKLLCKYFDLIYQNHRSFLSRHQIPLSKAPETISCSEEEMKRLIKKGMIRLEPYQENLSNIHSMQEIQFCLFLATIEPERKAIFVPADWKKGRDLSFALLDQLEQKVLPRLYSILFEKIQEMLTKQYGKLQEPLSYSEVLSARSCFIEKKSESYLQLQEKFIEALEPIGLENEWQKKYLSMVLIDELFKVLAEEDKIAYCNPEFGFRSNPHLCLFV